jgi:hypothetical protein
MAQSQSGTPLEKRWWVREMLAGASVAQLEEIVANFQNLTFRTQDPEYSLLCGVWLSWILRKRQIVGPKILR